MGRRGFAAANKLGRAGEERAAAVLRAAGLRPEANPAADRAGRAGWDLRFVLGPLVRTAEVKHDLYEARSGNVAVEYFNPRAGRPSGVAASTADLWVVVLADGSVWACRTADLRDYLATGPCVRDVPRAGDGNAAVRLYDRATLFAAIFVRLDDLPGDDLLTVITGMTEN